MTTVRICYVIIAGVAAMSLTGCGSGGTALPPGARSENAASPAAHSAARNRVFRAAYSGEYMCKPYGSGIRVWAIFHGRGSASFLRRSKEQIVYGGCGSSGTFTLWHPPYTASIHGNLVGAECSTDTYTVTGGTGRFVKATGSGTVTFSCSDETYSDQWSGNIKF